MGNEATLSLSGLGATSPPQAAENGHGAELLNFKQVVDILGLGREAARKLRENGNIKPAFPKRKGTRVWYRRTDVMRIVNG